MGESAALRQWPGCQWPFAVGSGRRSAANPDGARGWAHLVSYGDRTLRGPVHTGLSFLIVIRVLLF